MASSQTRPAVGDDFMQRVRSVPVGPAIGGLGFSSVAEDPNPMAEEADEAEDKQHLWNKWLNDGAEGQAVKLMIEDIDVAIQLLQSKVLCIMPINLLAAIYHSYHQQPQPLLVNIPDPDAPS